MDRLHFLKKWRRLILALIILTTWFSCPGNSASLPCSLFPADNVWNSRIDHLPAHPRSAEYVSRIGAQKNLHPDFGSGVWPSGSTSPIGIPFVTVPGTQPRVNVSFYYADESDPGPYPIPPGAPIEGGPDGTGDRHVLVLDRDACRLYELFDAWPRADGSWVAGSGAIFDLNSHALRPDGWTSADAAGLPILPGLIRYDEVAGGAITHAIRFTANRTQRASVWPARHFASTITDPTYPPMGQRFRLKAGFDINDFSPQVRVILQGFKTYGLILADNGSDWFVSGAPDERWDNDVLRELRQVPGSAFEAVDVSSLMLDPDSGQVRPSTPTWNTEIGIINPSPSAVLEGVLRGFDANGNQVWTRPVNLSAHGRLELDVAAAADNAASRIKSMRLDITAGQAVGYQKFYQAGKYRVGLEASPQANQANLYVPHIASNEAWWTGIGWTNTTNSAKTLRFSFDNGASATKTLAGGGHEAFTVASLFGDTPQPGIGAAQVSGGAGMVGLMLFGGMNSNILSGVTLSDSTTSTLFFPHVAHNNEWWTGLVVYNPGDETANLDLTYFDAQGVNLGRNNTEVGPGQKMVGTPEALSFPEGTAWFRVQASLPVTGFELFGTTDSNQLAGYSVVDLAGSSGVFPKLERNGWTGIVFVNSGEAAIQVQAQARNDEGDALATSAVDLSPGQKWVDQATALFSGQDISAATYISFTATGDVVGFQLNGSSDGMMLDAIPALGGTHAGTQQLYFPHIAVGN